MRLEILEVLLTVDNEKKMMAILSNGNKKELITIFEYLKFTPLEVQKRWQEALVKLLK
jgi:hypothetical protein